MKEQDLTPEQKDFYFGTKRGKEEWAAMNHSKSTTSKVVEKVKGLRSKKKKGS